MPEYIEKDFVITELNSLDILARAGVKISPVRIEVLENLIRIHASGGHGKWIHTDSHFWYSTEDGEIDEWRWDAEFHNGPSCEVCGYSPCVHCNPNYREEKCSVGHYVCSECEEPSVDGHEKFCPGCGAKMDLE